MVASSQAWWLLTRAPQGSEKLHQGPWVRLGHWGGCGTSTPGPRQAAQGLAALLSSSPPRPCPAVGRSGRAPSSRPCDAKCLDHPASSHSPAGPFLFSFGGARADPRLPTGWALGPCVLATSCRSPAHRLDLGHQIPRETKSGPVGAVGLTRVRVQCQLGGAAPCQLERPGACPVRVREGPARPLQSPGRLWGASMVQLASPGAHGSRVA